MSELFLVGVEVTAIGMGVVFVLLITLIAAVTIMSRISTLIVGDAQQGYESIQASPEQTGAQDDELISVIGSAIRSYRRVRKK